MSRAVRIALAAAGGATMLAASAGARAQPPGLPSAASSDVAQFRWSPAQAAELLQALNGAARHGLSPRRYLDLIEDSPGEARDDALTSAALAYAGALARGVVDPHEVHGIFTLHLNSIDVRQSLGRALAGGSLGEWLASLPPQDAEYEAISRAYVQALERSKGGASTDIPDGPLIRPGDADPRIPHVARILGLPLSGPSASAPQRYGPLLEASVRALQARSGIAVDGVIGPDTLSVLNTGPRDRARRLAVNLERRRWLHRRPPSTRIDVNIATAELHYVVDGRVAWTTRVIAGAAGNKTPLLEESFDHVVVNPPWYVPQSIAEAEILPKGPGYLAAHDMYLDNGRVIQRPGPQAALGKVKFDMRNPYAIYLHDTPAKSLFARAERHRSHGCVRVQDAVAFARRLAAEHGAADRFDRVLASGETGVVELGASVAVRLLYRTAFVDAAGAVRLRPDVYGWDGRLAEALGLGGERLRAPLPAPADPLSP